MLVVALNFSFVLMLLFGFRKSRMHLMQSTQLL